MILVTGGAGYIGSIVTEQLILKGYEVVVFDNLYQGHRQAVHPDAHFFLGDLANKDEVEEVFARYEIDGILHFASYTLVGESMQKPFLYLGGNLTNALNLLETAVAHNVKRFILSSTANLFDKPERIPIAETEQIVPGSPYGESKFMIERLLHWLDKTQGLRYAALRYFNACGASPIYGEDHDPETHLIPLVLQVALGQRDHIKIFGTDYPTPDGTCIRDYVHIIDLAQAHILALEAITTGPSRAYNLGNGNGFSVQQVIDTTRQVTGHPIPAIATPRRPGDPATLIADSTKIRQELNWQPQYPDLQQIIETAWAWHQRYPDGYDNPYWQAKLAELT
ncbi:MAG TPA: UDP-glucose 4-epimerase GalE [Anaerolineae bacterium]|nr:UDP-glucose 4-epimerase GalE [Anaerolineae bacterium]